MLYAPDLVNNRRESQVKARCEKDGNQIACEMLIDILLRSGDIEWPEKFLNGIQQLNAFIAELLRNKLEEVKKKDGKLKQW